MTLLDCTQGKKAAGRSAKRTKTVVKKRGTKVKRDKHTMAIKKVKGRKHAVATKKVNTHKLQSPTITSSVVPQSTAFVKKITGVQLPGCEHMEGRPSFGHHRIVTMRVSSGEELNIGDNFLSYLTGYRRHVVTMGVDEILKGTRVPLKYEDEMGRVYQLISSKECEDNSVGSTLWSAKKKLLELFYMLTSGPHDETVDPGDYLSCFGNFAKLDTRKVSSRLELFQSPGRLLNDQYILKFNKNNFLDIKESGHEGCGFIDEEMLQDIIGRKKDGEPTKMAASTLCIQVRVYIPSKGECYNT